jgi:hypothetical protein
VHSSFPQIRLPKPKTKKTTEEKASRPKESNRRNSIPLFCLRERRRPNSEIQKLNFEQMVDIEMMPVDAKVLDVSEVCSTRDFYRKAR